MKPGSIVELKIPPAGPGAKVGARALVVDGQKEFPNLHKELVDQLPNDSLLSEFIWVKWDRNHPHHMQDGAYAAARFETIQEAADSEPRNNDGRTHCWWCCAPTQKMQGFSGTWDICPECGK